MNLLQIIYEINDFLNQGGMAMHVIYWMAVMLWILILERFIYIVIFSKKERINLLNEWQRCMGHRDAHQIRECLQVIFKDKLFSGFEFIKVLTIIAPLLGLYGTVYGMIEIFDVVAQTGTGDARAMANGISMATLSTMSGMAVAIIGLIFRHRVESMAKKRAVSFNEMLEIK